MKYPIIIEEHYGINVLRDDLLIGGTKSILMPTIVGNKPYIKEFVYASPVYGGFQIALSAYCQSVGKKATIFCAKRNKKHPNTLKCLEYGAKVIEVPYGYLSVVEKKAREYCERSCNRKDIEKIVFGANTDENKELIANRMIDILEKCKTPPDEIWCAIGSGTLVSGILKGIEKSKKKIKVYGVQVGADYKNKDKNLTIIKYPKSFDKESKLKIDFPSTPNYDLKAFELCIGTVDKAKSKNILFWNVL
jgi:1-aminocyclopropane-1-carboxylate deaminase/D-cysteine desulfhydrase-like pyridoxal-dependent ACC family enzyme